MLGINVSITNYNNQIHLFMDVEFNEKNNSDCHTYLIHYQMSNTKQVAQCWSLGTIESETYSWFWNATTPISCKTNGSSGAILRACVKNLRANFVLFVKPYSNPMYKTGKWHLEGKKWMLGNKLCLTFPFSINLNTCTMPQPNWL